jgi:uncharacterized protein (TIGR03790 family)
MRRIAAAILLVLFGWGSGSALEPNEILVIVNKDIAESERLGRYYCQRRAVPSGNILQLSLGRSLRDTIGRAEYDKWLAEPIRKELSVRRAPGQVRCLLTTYGVPFKVGRRGPLRSQEGRLRELKPALERAKKRLAELKQDTSTGDKGGSAEQRRIERSVKQLQLEIDRIEGKETNASVDSELSMVLYGDYELYRWQPNMLRNDVMGIGFKTLMVSRLDGPDYGIAEGLVDKAIAAEQTGLKGTAYIDSRGLASKSSHSPGHYDQSLRTLAMFTRLRTEMPVKEERTEELFAPGSCPETAIYCGWYNLKKYVDAFDFVNGAVGYHIASFEAADLRDPNSSQWCPAMLTKGITATLGAVSEPYLQSFPEPKLFFTELFRGSCLVEAYYHTKPFNSWQLVLIGDPLYRPFKKN